MSTKDFDADALRRSFTMIGLDYAAPSPTNPRQSFPDAEMAELAESIKAHGLLQPILVRTWPLSYAQPGPLVTYEIVAGERRWRAAKLAGLTMIEAKHRELSDLEVLEIQIIENLQRADLHPLEEAEGYERIMSTHAYTAEQLGEKIGKSRSYIFGRLKLLALDDDARRLFRGGLLNPSTALLVARVPTTALRAKAIKEITEPNHNGDIFSVRQAHEFIKRRFMLKLADAPFPIGNADLTPAGSCEVCPKRTGNVPDLFDDIDSPDVCTDPDCFVKKKMAHRDQQAEKVSSAGGKVIVGDEAKKLAPYGIEKYTDLKGYTQLDKTCHDDPEKRTFREILGEDTEQVVIEDVRLNVMVPVIPNNVLADKLLAAGVKMREEESAKGNAKVEAKLVLERATRGRMFEMLRENIEVLASEGGGFAFPVQAELFQALVLRLWGRGDFEQHARIANLWATSGKNNTERIERFAATIPGMNDVECWTLATDLLFSHSTVVASEWDLDRGGKQLIAFASRFDIDEGETRKFVQDELKAKEKEAKPVKKTAKKTKNSPSAEAPPPLKAAQAGDVSAENNNFPVANSTIAEFKKLPNEAAPASDPTAEENQATPPAGAGLIERVEKPEAAADPEAFPIGTRVRVGNDVRGTAGNRRKCCGREGVIEAIQGPYYAVRFIEKAATPSAAALATPESAAPTAEGEKAIETNATPAASPADDGPYRTGDRVRIRSTAKFWRAAGQEAILGAQPRQGMFVARYGPKTCDVVGVTPDEIAGRITGKLTSWEKAAGVSTGEDDPEDAVTARCDKTVGMFQESAAS